MGRVALRGITAHLVRFALSVLAVALGVSFVAGTFALRTMLSSTFSDIVETTTLGDTYVRGVPQDADGEATVSEDFSLGAARTRVPLTLVDDLAAVDGVDAVVPALSGSVILVGADGTAVINSQAPSFGMGYDPGDPALQISQGRAPENQGEVALEAATLVTSGLKLGDTTSVIVGDGITEVEVVGEVGGVVPMAGATMTFFDLDTARAAFASDGRVATIAVYAADGVTERELTDRVTAAVDGLEAEAVTGEVMREESQASIESALGFINTFLLVFAGISLFVGAFIIANTFTMSVRQRMKELALLRAVGASPMQVFGSVMVQAVVVGILGALLGVAGGLGLVSLLRIVFERMGMDLGSRIPLEPQTVIVSLLIGTVVSVLAAALPARRAALVPPVEAMREDVAEVEHSLRLRAVLGMFLLVAGGAAVAFAALAPTSMTWVEENDEMLLAGGAIGVIIGMLATAPVFARGAVTVLAAPVVALLKPLGSLARGNVTRNPRRTASTAGALMIGMALVGGAAVTAASTQASLDSLVGEEFTGDFLVQSATFAIPADVVDPIAAVDGVASVEPLTYALVHLTADGAEPEQVSAVGVDPAVFERALDVTVVAGDLGDLGEGTIAVQRGVAEDKGWAVGDEVEITSDDRSVMVEVAAVIDARTIGTALIMPSVVFDQVVPPMVGIVDTIIIDAVPGADLEQVRAGLTEVVKPYVVLSVLDGEDLASRISAQVNQMLYILYALLGLSIVIAALGIVNTLALSVIERTREIGLLRAVGLGRLQLAGTITIESVLTAVFGTVAGLVVGVALAGAMTQVYADEGLGILVVPWGSLGGMLLLAVVLGGVAAVWPAIRAARMPVLDAVSYE